MGIDACIYVRTGDGLDPDLCDALPEWAEIIPADTSAPAGATYEIQRLGWRYYGPGYERGPWPLLAATLMALYAASNVEAVWYFGDHTDDPEPFTPDLVNKFSAYYMKHGDRPYRRS